MERIVSAVGIETIASFIEHFATNITFGIQNGPNQYVIGVRCVEDIVCLISKATQVWR
jgi:hypothetical protein